MYWCSTARHPLSDKWIQFIWYFHKPHGVIKNVYLLFVAISTLYSQPLGYWLVENLNIKSMLHLRDKLQQQIFFNRSSELRGRETKNNMKASVENKTTSYADQCFNSSNYMFHVLYINALSHKVIHTPVVVWWIMHLVVRYWYTLSSFIYSISPITYKPKLTV